MYDKQGSVLRVETVINQPDEFRIRRRVRRRGRHVMAWVPLARTPIPLTADPLKQSAQVTRLLRCLHAHGLIAKIPHSRGWCVSFSGSRVMAAAIKLRDVASPSLYAEAA